MRSGEPQAGCPQAFEPVHESSTEAWAPAKRCKGLAEPRTARVPREGRESKNGSAVSVEHLSFRYADSRFALKEDTAKGFFVFLERLQTSEAPLAAVKGQITGPFTLGTGIADQNKKPIFYDTQLKDAAVKLLAMKARWQVRKLSTLQKPVMIFFDEPALAGVGSSEFTSISNLEINQGAENDQGQESPVPPSVKGVACDHQQQVLAIERLPV